MKKTLSYESLKGNFRSIVLIDKIVRLSKSEQYGGTITKIHLVNGEILETYDSLNTLEARINED